MHTHQDSGRRCRHQHWSAGVRRGPCIGCSMCDEWISPAKMGEPCRLVVPALAKLPQTLLDERGYGDLGCAISRFNPNGPWDTTYLRQESVGEFLAREENQSGCWLIDGGWGGPPGPIRVRWVESINAWVNDGFPPWQEPRL